MTHLLHALVWLIVGRNKPVRAIARTGVSGTPNAGNAPPLLSPGGLIPAYILLHALAWLIVGLCANPALAKEKLTVLTAYPEDVVSRYETAFEQTYPDIDLAVIWKMPHDALPYLKQPKQGGVDVYWSASQRNFMVLKQQHAWQKLGIDRSGLADSLGALPLVDTDGYFCVTEMAGYGFAVNADYLKKHGLATPKTWQDLADTHYQGHLALPVPSRVGFAPMMIDSVLQQYGWEPGWALLSDIVANARLVESGSTFITDIIGSGERGIAPTIDFFTASAAANGAPLHFIYPEPVAYSPAHIAIAAASQHTDAARRFVSFVLSDRGQKLLFHPDIRKLPVRASVYADKPDHYFDPFSETKAHPVVYDPSRASPRLALNNALFDRLFSDHLQRLQNLWLQLRKHQQSAKADQAERLVKIRQLLTGVPVNAAKAETPTLQQTFSERSTDKKAEAEAQALEQAWSKEIDSRYAEAENLLKQLGP
ncbi:ABC transporter substrate-binding protein [Methylobacter sp.]|uniref:ABC transporter substrate-binding protein n=1 Tax=Methylobacter sp. TaxID=2051955 RepID=UPI002FDE1D1E